MPGAIVKLRVMASATERSGEGRGMRVLSSKLSSFVFASKRLSLKLLLLVDASSEEAGCMKTHWQEAWMHRSTTCASCGGSDLPLPAELLCYAGNMAPLGLINPRSCSSHKGCLRQACRHCNAEHEHTLVILTSGHFLNLKVVDAICC